MFTTSINFGRAPTLKVRIFWEGHKIWNNLPLKIWCYWVVSNLKWKIFSNFLWPSQNIRTLLFVRWALFMVQLLWVMPLNLNGKMQGKPEAGPPTVIQDSEKENKVESFNTDWATPLFIILLSDSEFTSFFSKKNQQEINNRFKNFFWLVKKLGLVVLELVVGSGEQDNSF